MAVASRWRCIQYLPGQESVFVCLGCSDYVLWRQMSSQVQDRNLTTIFLFQKTDLFQLQHPTPHSCTTCENQPGRDPVQWCPVGAAESLSYHCSELYPPSSVTCPCMVFCLHKHISRYRDAGKAEVWCGLVEANAPFPERCRQNTSWVSHETSQSPRGVCT